MPGWSSRSSRGEVHEGVVESYRILVYDHAGHPFQLELSEALAARGHEVEHWYCAQLETPRGRMERGSDRLKVGGIDIGKPFAKHSTWRRWAQERELGRALSEKVRGMRPDVVIVANSPLRTQDWAMRACREVGGAFIIWVQDLLGIGISQNLRKRWGWAGNLVGAYIKRYERRLLRSADRLVLIVEDFQPHIPPDARARSTVIENWAPLSEMPLTERENAWSREIGCGPGLRFFYTGTLGLKHNPRMLVALGEQLQAVGGSLTVLSQGKVAEWLKHEAQARGLSALRVMPFQPFERMPQVLGAGDVLVVLLERDSGVFAVPSKLLTYLCAGRAILAAVPEENLAARIVETSGAGICVAPDDVPGFLEGADKLASDPRLRAEMGAYARRYAESRFDVGKKADAFEAAIREAVYGAVAGQRQAV